MKRQKREERKEEKREGKRGTHKREKKFKDNTDGELLIRKEAYDGSQKQSWSLMDVQ